MPNPGDAPVTVPLRKVDRPGKGDLWTLELARDTAMVRDPAGEVRNAFTATEAAALWELPSFSDSIKYISMPIGGGPTRFDATRHALALVRTFVRRGVADAGPEAVQGLRRRATLELVIGFLSVMAGCGLTAASLSGLMGTGQIVIFYGLVLVGLIEIGRGASQLRECRRIGRGNEPPGAPQPASHLPQPAPTAPPRASFGTPQPAMIIVEQSALPRRGWRPGTWIMVILCSLVGLLVAAGVASFFLPPANLGQFPASRPRPPAPAVAGAPGPGPASLAPPEPAPPSLARTEPAEAPSFLAGVPGDEGAARAPKTDPQPASAPPTAEPAPTGTPAPPASMNLPPLPALRALSGRTPRETSDLSIGGQLEPIAAPPSVKAGDLVSDARVRIFREASRAKLLSALACDYSKPGVYHGSSPATPVSVEAGTVVNSYVLHIDGASNRVSRHTVSVQFPYPILGVIASRSSLDASDSAVGNTTTTYPTGGQWRAFFDGDEEDWIVISEDRRTLGLRSHTRTFVDQVRVITASKRQ